MDHYHAEDTPLNFYLRDLRNLVYQYMGASTPKVIQCFEDKFYERLNMSNAAKIEMAEIFNNHILGAVTGCKITLEDVTECL